MQERYIPYEVYKNAKVFFEYRGIIPDPKTNLNMSREELVKILIREEHVKLIGTNSKNNNRKFMLVIIAPSSKYALHTPQFKKLMNNIPLADPLDLMFISETPLTNFIQKELVEQKKKHPSVYIEHHKYSLLTIIIPNHDLSQKHILLTPTQAKEFTESNYTSPIEYSKIRAGDPMIVWLGAKPGDFIKVERASESTGKAITYHYVLR